ncbi:MAG: hypothetical protein AUI14_05190 [Actinobacteria bacterium 13_2_20CM_2_71_6]|nr:MAG: hypothetical protein AUI14_05190 [Actinobacteria bacterium 13_2_20CM_2_71_6]
MTGERRGRVVILLTIATLVAATAAALPLFGIHRWWWAPVSAGGAAALAVLGLELRTWLDVERRPSLTRRQDQVDRGASTMLTLAAERGSRRRLPTVSECDARRLGVHASIASEPDRPATADLPTYVPRDADAHLRTALRAAAVRGGFLLLVGRSSVGKTRTAYEAARDVLGDWSLWQPDDAASVIRVAAGPPPLRRTVIWLDELQNYLEGSAGLVAAPVRRLLSADEPVVLIGTMWPDRYLTLVSGPVMDTRGQVIEDPFAPEREVLGLAEVIDIGNRLTGAERHRARTIAEVDSRIAVALRSTDYGMTQVLAAAPDLVRRWDHAPPCARAVITAAIDARRIGVDAPLPADFFGVAARGYLQPDEVADATTTWLEDALAYATEKVRGAAAVLTPVGANMGEAVGYTVAEYLLQYGQAVRRTRRVPEHTWQALLDLAAPADDFARVADAAECRGLLVYAERCYRRAIASGDGTARARLASLMEARGQHDEAENLWRAGIAAGDPHAARGLVDLLELQGKDAEVVRVLRESPMDLPSDTRWRLAILLERLERYGEAEEKWRESIAAGDPDARWRLAVLLERLGRFDDAEEILRSAVALGEPGGYRRLVILLEHLGRSRDMEQALRAAMAAGEQFARRRLILLLERLGRDPEAKEIERADLPASPGPPVPVPAGPPDTEPPPEVRAQLGALSERLGRAASPAPGAPAPPSRSEAEPAPEVEIGHAVRRAAAGTDPYAWRRLAFLLERLGRHEDADQLRRFGLSVTAPGREAWWSRPIDPGEPDG